MSLPGKLRRVQHRVSHSCHKTVETARIGVVVTPQRQRHRSELYRAGRCCPNVIDRLSMIRRSPLCGRCSHNARG